jgi:hypothetical protein
VGVAGGDLRVGRDVPEDGSDLAGGAEGERAAFVELGVVLVHLGQGQDISGCGLEIGSVPNRVERQWLRDVQAGVGPEVGDRSSCIQQEGTGVLPRARRAV